jgi:hypothetical protein
MPLTFLEAKKRINPDPAFQVSPGSQVHKDILELMRQSGHVFAEDNTPAPTMPPPQTRQDMLPFREREAPALKPKALSKEHWLSVEVNRKDFYDHIEKHQHAPPGFYEPEPAHISWGSKTAPFSSIKQMSKQQWIASLVNKI